MPLKGPTASNQVEMKNIKEEMRLREAETARLRNENLDMTKRLKSMMSCQICDEPFDNKWDFLFIDFSYFNQKALTQSIIQRTTIFKTKVLAYHVRKMRPWLVVEGEIELQCHLPNLPPALH